MRKTRRCSGSQSASHQKGSVLLTAVTLVFASILLFVLSLSSDTLTVAKKQLISERESITPRAAQEVESWYLYNANTVDATDSTIDSTFLALNALTDRRQNVQVAASQRLGLPCASTVPANACVPYRKFVVWVPPTGAVSTSIFDAVTGEFTPGNAQYYSLIDGKGIQLELARQSLKSLNTVAEALQKYFQARAAYTAIGNSRLNYFRPVNCASVLLGEILCYDTYTSASVTNLSTVVGLSANDFVTAWGGQISFSNLQDSNTSRPPYSSSVTLSAPWGATFNLRAVQPL